MATTVPRPATDIVEGAPREVAALRRRRLAAPSRPPATAAEAIEVADLAQLLVPEGTDPGHDAFSTIWHRWCDRMTT